MGAGSNLAALGLLFSGLAGHIQCQANIPSTGSSTPASHPVSGCFPVYRVVYSCQPSSVRLIYRPQGRLLLPAIQCQAAIPSTGSSTPASHPLPGCYHLQGRLLLPAIHCQAVTIYRVVYSCQPSSVRLIYCPQGRLLLPAIHCQANIPTTVSSTPASHPLSG